MVKNIRLLNPNFVRRDGFFLSVDHQTDTIIQKADDGTLAFAFPLDTPIANQVISLEFDGESFWTMERINDSSPAQGFLIKRWIIENFVGVLQQTFVFQTNSQDTFESNAFTVENYKGSLISSKTMGATEINVLFDNDPDGTVFNLLTPGTRLFLGPSSANPGEFATVTVNGTVIPNTVSLTSGLPTGFSAGDKLTFSKNLWFFNQHFLKTTGVGALYKVNSLDGNILSRTQGGAFKDIDAAGFANVTAFQPGTPLFSLNNHYLLFVRTNSLLFIDVNDPQLTTVLSAIQNNLSPDTTEVFPVSDLAIEGNTIFRLQKKFNVNNQQTTETTFNYQLATFRPFPTAIALTAVEAIIAAGNATSNSTITAIVTDQYALPFSTSPPSTILFSFTGGGTGAAINPSVETNIGPTGIVTATYTSGTLAGLVTIQAEVFIRAA